MPRTKLKTTAVAGDEKVNVRQTLKKLIGYVRPQMWLIIISMICAAATAALNILGPIYARDVTNLIRAGLITGINFDELIRLTLIEVGIYGGAAVLMWMEGFMMTTVTQKLVKRMRRDISCKIDRLPLKYFDTTSYGDTLSRVTNDADTVGQSLNQAIITLVLATVLLIGSIIMMFVTSAALAGSAIGATLIGFVIMILILSRSQKYFTRQQSQLGAVDGYIEETFSGQLVVKAFGAEEPSKIRFRKINSKLYESAWKSQFFSSTMGPLMTFTGNLGYLTVFVVGAALVINTGLDIGVITAFILYVRLFSQPLSQLAQVMTSIQPATAAAARVFEFLDEQELAPEKPDAKPTIDAVKGDIVFEHVNFGYSPDRTIINDFSATISSGQKVAIVGPTGAGKTTLVNLLMRFYEINSGNILIDGTPISAYTREAVHSIFGMVLQDAWLFSGTVRENVAYSNTNVSDEEIEAACRKAGLEHFIKTLPQGYDTVLDESANVSQGQRQLFTIARAMVENAPMLILDEATSSVDTRTEILIQQAMDELSRGRTSFVIAHRLSTIKNADLILVMNKGDIVEFGKHEELLENKGFYYELYNSQFQAAA